MEKRGFNIEEYCNKLINEIAVMEINRSKAMEEYDKWLRDYGYEDIDSELA